MSAISIESEWFTVHELAAWLKVSVPTIYGWRYQGYGPPAVKLGKHLRYRRADVEAWILDREANPSSPEVAIGRKRTAKRVS